MLGPLPDRVVQRQVPGEQDVGQADGHVRDDQADEDPGRPPPGPRVAHRVELVPVAQQHGQDGRGGSGLNQVGDVHHVDEDAEREQHGDRLPGAAFAAPEPVGQHQQQQPDDHRCGTGEVRHGAGHEDRDAVQPVVQVQARDRDPDDVGEPDQQAEPSHGDRHPAALMPAVGRTPGVRPRMAALIALGRWGGGRGAGLVGLRHVLQARHHGGSA